MILLNHFFIFVHINNGEKNMKVLITGAASGIGFDTAISLAKKGHFVYCTVHTDSQVERVREKLEGYLELPIDVFRLDITKEKDRKKILDLEIDCLINNAAIGVGGSILNLSVDQIRENFEVNVFSTIELIQLFVGHLFLEKRPGKIIIMSYLAGIIPIPFLSSYSATKASLITLATALKKEISMLDLDISVKLIEPGIYYTGFNEYMLDSALTTISDCKSHILQFERKMFTMLGKKDTKDIVFKIVKAVESSTRRFLYRAPLLHVLGAKIYMLFCK